MFFFFGNCDSERNEKKKCKQYPAKSAKPADRVCRI